MRLMLDLNILVDVFAQREPFYFDSAWVLGRVARFEHEGCTPGHALPTVYYIVRRHSGREAARGAVDWILGHLKIVPGSKSDFRKARTSPLQDFEDAVVVSAAESAQCEAIITRNAPDFARSPIRALRPADLLTLSRLHDP
jgi:predicted nucleic acid-binding protein